MTYASANQPSSLSQILEKSRLLANKINTQELTPIERGLTQITEQSQALTTDTAPSNNSHNVKAHYFLAQAGVNTQVLMQELGTMHLGEPVEHRQPIKDTDIEAYFNQRRTQNILDLMQSERQEILEDMQNVFELDIESTWRELRERLCPDALKEDQTIEAASTTMLKTKLASLNERSSYS
ncbi:hypothetical protein BDF14DRAFT_1767273 [Spinellus fusiger]|nr:hypothetical protein BDF14DRAFT_1767273 [Spinellus fusiger]